MQFKEEFVDIALADLRRESALKKADGSRFIQTHAVYTDDGIDLYYSFMKDGTITNLRVPAVQKGEPVPSITDLFLAAFVFENEARELFGVNMQDIAIDFAGALYAPAENEPMTIITPEQKAAREKARKAAAAKAAKSASSADEPASAAPAAGGFVMTPERQERLNKKLATMSPEKVAKVEAALKARAAESAAGVPAAGAKEEKQKEAPAKDDSAAEKPAAQPVPESPVDEALEAKIAAMNPQKAAKVRAALGMGEAETESAAADDVQGMSSTDSELAEKIAMMDPGKAEKVRAALKASAASKASEGGE